MNELDVLSDVRTDVAPMSERARLAGRAQLTAAMAAADPTASPAPRLRPIPRRRLVTGLATVLGLAATATVVLVLGAPADQRPAAAADVLNRAAEVLEADPGPPPRPDQYLFQEERGGIPSLVAGRPDLRSWAHDWSWQAIDGTRPGLVRETVEDISCGLPTRYATVQPGLSPPVRAVDLCRDSELQTPVYNPRDGLRYAPYTVLAQLPTDPATILAALGAYQSDSGGQLTAIASVIDRLPPAQRAALFRAMAKLPGAVLYPHTKDAAGRDGVGIGLDSFRLGNDVSKVVYIFNRATSRYLGYNILNTGGGVMVDNAVLRTAFVDKVGQMPS
jgi:hypothetical protein